VLREPHAMIVCFSSSVFNIYRVGDAMAKIGWSLNALQKPACLHVCVTIQMVHSVGRLLADLQRVVKEIKDEGNDVPKKGNAAMYGMAGSLPPGPVNQLLMAYVDATLTP
jgi:sphinganine-1-phosphate aldolase